MRRFKFCITMRYIFQGNQEDPQMGWSMRKCATCCTAGFFLDGGICPACMWGPFFRNKMMHHSSSAAAGSAILLYFTRTAVVTVKCSIYLFIYSGFPPAFPFRPPNLAPSKPKFLSTLFRPSSQGVFHHLPSPHFSSSKPETRLPKIVTLLQYHDLQSLQFKNIFHL